MTHLFIDHLFVFLGSPIGVILFISILIALVLISIQGGAVIQWGKEKFVFGKSKNKRSCKDCLLIIMKSRDECEYNTSTKRNSILRDQMNFAEQKILELKGILLNDYREQLTEKRDQENVDPIEENKQYLLYNSVLTNILEITKDEIRRSFKENGFEGFNGQEFSNYVKNKAQTLISLSKTHMLNQYPYTGMIIPLAERIKRFEPMSLKIEDMTFDVYIHAKEIKVTIDKEIKQLREKFASEVDILIGVKDATDE